MKKQFLKDEIWFALIWIVLYVVGFSYAERITSLLRLPDQIQLVLGLVLSVILYLYIRRSRLQEYYGLCESKGREKDYLWFVPLIVISSANLWSGIARNADLTETVIYMLSMCTVGFLEEVIFRGLLFKGLCKTNVTMAILVSALTFGPDTSSICSWVTSLPTPCCRSWALLPSVSAIRQYSWSAAVSFPASSPTFLSTPPIFCPQNPPIQATLSSP